MKMFCFFVATFDEILLYFLKNARSRQSYCASHVARTFITRFTARVLQRPVTTKGLRLKRQILIPFLFPTRTTTYPR